jgi:segregation and condensation protein B
VSGKPPAEERVGGIVDLVEPPLPAAEQPAEPAWKRGVLDSGQAVPDPNQLAEPARLMSVVESLLLVAERPLGAADLARFLGVAPDRVEGALAGIAEDLDGSDGGMRLVEVAGGFRLRTAPANGPWVQAFLGKRPVKLSRAALESLAIVAYREPVTRSEVEDVRGVDSSVVLRSLLEKDLLRISGRKDEPGRPMLYATTRRFLEVFGLRGLSDLPSLREFADLAIGEQEELFGGDPMMVDSAFGSEDDDAAEADDAEDASDDPVHELADPPAGDEE